MNRLEHDWFDRPLPANVHLGERSWLHSSFAFLHFRSNQDAAVRTGHDTGIYDGTFFDLGPQGAVDIGAYSTIVGAIISSNGRVVIGDYVFIAHQVVLADSSVAVPPHDRQSLGPATPSAPIVIEDDVWIGANAIVLAGARIGARSIVGAGTVVDFEVPPDSLVAGNPAMAKPRRRGSSGQR